MQLIRTPEPAQPHRQHHPRPSKLCRQQTSECHHAGSHHSKSSMRRHGEAWTPAACNLPIGVRPSAVSPLHRSVGSPLGSPTAVCACGRGDHNDAAILLVFWSGILVVPFWCGFTHCRRSVLQGEERGQGVDLETLLQVAGSGRFDGGWTEEASATYPHIQTVHPDQYMSQSFMGPAAYRPHVFKTSSMRSRVASSFATLYG